MKKFYKYFIIYIATFGALHGLNAYENVLDNFFIGVKSGAAFNHYTLKAQNTLDKFTIKKTSNKTDFIGIVSLGYGHTFPSCFYLGCEIETIFPHRYDSIKRPGVALTTLTFTNHMTIQDYLLIDLLPGYRFNKNFLAYLRAGLSVGKISMKQFETLTTPEFKNNKNVVGGNFGLSLIYAITRNFDFGIEYFYNFYKSLNTELKGFNTKVNTKVYTNFLVASISYSF